MSVSVYRGSLPPALVKFIERVSARMQVELRVRMRMCLEFRELREGESVYRESVEALWSLEGVCVSVA